jgi:magnesium transporter
VQRIYHLQTQVRELLVAIDALHDPLLRFIRWNRHHLDAEVEAELSEAVEQLGRAVSRAQSLADLLTSALNANMAQLSLHQNEDMRKISAWVAIAAVPTMVAGLYGMNFDHMPELHWAYSYPVLLGAVALACALLYRNFRRSGWL